MRLFASSSTAIPREPLVLGLAGLIPFWGLAIGLVARGFGPWSVAVLDAALVTYAAVIISFLGGIRWGLAVARGAPAARWQYALAVLPSLAAWASLLLPEPWRLASLGVLALALGPLDLGLVKAGLAPRWFGRLRLILSCGAGVALILGAVATRG